MTDFLFDVGTNGYIATPFNLLTTELDGKTTGSLSGLGGAKSQTDTVSALLADLVFEVGSGGFTPASTLIPIIPLWFIRSKDGGTAYEKSGSAPVRAPDAVFSFLQSAYAAGDLVWAPRVVLPVSTFKTLGQNLTGSTLPATANKVWLCPLAVKY